jgi:hypothetical protein
MARARPQLSRDPLASAAGVARSLLCASGLFPSRLARTSPFWRWLPERAVALSRPPLLRAPRSTLWEPSPGSPVLSHPVAWAHSGGSSIGSPGRSRVPHRRRRACLASRPRQRGQPERWLPSREEVACPAPAPRRGSAERTSASGASGPERLSVASSPGCSFHPLANQRLQLTAALRGGAGPGGPAAAGCACREGGRRAILRGGSAAAAEPHVRWVAATEALPLSWLRACRFLFSSCHG